MKVNKVRMVNKVKMNKMFFKVVSDVMSLNEFLIF